MTPFTGLNDVKNSLTVFTSVFVVVFIAQRVYIVRQRKGNRRLPPALWSVPVVGSIPFLPTPGQLPPFFGKKSCELGPIFSIHMGPIYAVVLNGKRCIQEALEKCSTTFAGRTMLYLDRKYLNPSAYGILNGQYGTKFRRNHQLILSILKEFGFGQSLINQRIHAEAEELVCLIKEKEGQALSLDSMVNMCTMNVIASILSGKRCSQTDRRLQTIQRHINICLQKRKRIIDICPIVRFIPQYQNNIKMLCNSSKIFKSAIEEIIREAAHSSEESFIKRFIERQGVEYDEEDLVYICRDLFVAGSDTTANSLLWALVEMANHQDIQTRVRNEIDSIVPTDRYTSIDDMGNMPYAEAAILELMRRWSIVPLAILHSTLADSEVQGYFIPNGTMVMPNLYSVHMDPNMWVEPHVYRPERFLDDKGHVTGRDRIIPFSLGKRSCLGELLARQELFVLFTTLIQQFKILPPEGVDKIICEENFVITVSPTPYKVRLVPRL